MVVLLFPYCSPLPAPTLILLRVKSIPQENDSVTLLLPVIGMHQNYSGRYKKLQICKTTLMIRRISFDLINIFHQEVNLLKYT